MTLFADNCLAGGTYLVTGASSGIGRATAKLIARSGGRVIAAGRDEARLNATLAELSGEGHAVAAADFADANQTAQWMTALAETHGAFAGVFHAAGIEMIRPAKLTKQEQVNQVFASSVFAAFGIAQSGSRKNVIADGGSLVFMSSVAGSTGQAGMTAYSSAKAAVDGLVRSLACEMAARKIRVNSIAAGAVHTAMHDRLTTGSTDEALAAYEKSHLLGFGDADDVANSALFLLSDASRWITGTTLVVDGGYKVR
jgi:NAD(P)-dependent dehydrogenase (short-subunit alcohol dehydrogenase family)